MTEKHPRRIEWISLVYLGFFALAVLAPSIIQENYFGIEQVHLEEALIFVFGITGLGIFALYQRAVERKEQEHRDARDQYERARRELVESYQYIGSINRQIEVLKGLANQTSLSIVESRKLSKDLFASILAGAVATASAEMAYLRFVELDKLRTLHEMAHRVDGVRSLKISNKELKHLHESGATHAFLRTEDQEEILVIPSDRQGERVKAYLIIMIGTRPMPNADVSLLKVFANQAELLYHELQGQSKDGDHDPMSLIRRAEHSSIGEIS